MQIAFDVVCQHLSLAPEDKRRRRLATVIIDIATAGEIVDLAENAADRLRT
jgi:transcription elongation GreA/GreB family factor